MGFSRFSLHTGLALLLAGMSFTAAHAQTPSVVLDDEGALVGPEIPIDLDFSSLDVTVVTATRELLTIENTPNSVEFIDSETILKRGARTLPELLRETPSVMVQKTGHGQGSPFIRGFTGYRNLGLIDGIRLNNSVFRDGPNQYWNTIDMQSVRGVELVKGQGSVLYGSDAIGGTLNVLTARPRYSDDGGIVAGGRVYGRYATGEDSYTARFETTVSEADKFGFIMGVTGRDFGDLRVADTGRQRKTGYDEFDFDVKFEYFLDPTTRLTLLHQQVHVNNAWRTHRTLFGNSFRGTTVGSEQARILDQDRYLTYIQLEGEAYHGLFDHYQFSLSHHRQSEERFRIRKIGDGRQDRQGFDVDSYGAAAQFDLETKIGTFTYGASYYLDEIDSFRENFRPDGSFASRAIQGPIADDSRYHLADVFVQDHIEISDQLDLWLGGRFTYAKAEIGRAEDPVSGEVISFGDEWTNFVGSARFLYDVSGNDTLGIFGGVSQGFRAPNLSDLSRLDTARSDEIETPSPGLDPEQFISYEIGLRTNLNAGTRASLAYYYTDIDDLIIGRRTGRVIDGDFEVTKVNAGSGYVHGVEFEAEHDISDSLTLFGWASWQDGEQNDEPISRLMPFTAEAGLRWTCPQHPVWMELVALGATKQDKLSARDARDTQRIPSGGTSGYVIGIIRGGWEIQPEFTLTAGLENITDESYRVHGSGINGVGRNFFVGGEWVF